MRSHAGKIAFLFLALIVALAGIGLAGAMWSKTLYIHGTVSTGTWEEGGTPGFWKNWDSHETYTQGEIEGWLALSDAQSEWLGPTDVGEMVDWLSWEECDACSAECKFLAHYLATRLNAQSGRLDLGSTHDVTSLDPGNYLGLPAPGSAALSDIISALEDKYPPDPDDPDAVWPTDAQYLIMKDICDALNNVNLP